MEKLKAILTGAKDYGLRGFKMFQENKMSVYSGYATLFIVTAVFPCAMLIISVVNLLPGYSTKDVTDILVPDPARPRPHQRADRDIHIQSQSTVRRPGWASQQRSPHFGQPAKV